MSDQKLVSPLLDGFAMGNPMGSHDGVRCCPAIKENSDEKYIVKIISIPASQVQLDALLLTGAYSDPADATEYFRSLADGVVAEAEFLQKLSRLEGFLSYDSWQVEPMADGKLGYEIYLLGAYKRSLEKHLRRHVMTHLEAVNLSLDICQALAICRKAGSIYVDLKPENIYISKGKEYRIGDLGFVELDCLQYTSLPAKYRSPYSPPEVQDALNTLNLTVDTYALGMILYQIFNDGSLPAAPRDPKEPFPSPANADYELAEIIMKAVAPDPTDRWQDPMAMGQALVAYMQRNSVNNTPIKAPALILDDADRPAPQAAEPEAAAEEAAPEAVPTDAASRESDAEIPVQEPNDVPADTGTPDAEAASVPVPIFDETAVEDEDVDDEDFRSLLKGYDEESPAVEDIPEIPEEEPEKPKKEKKPRKPIGTKWVAPVVTILILALLCCAGIFYYQNMYLQTIDALTVDGTMDALTVTVVTDTDPSLLTVSCADTYGNTQRKALTDGQVVFTDLQPNSQYKIQLEISGFHKLIGQTTEIFNTEAQTNVVSFTAVTGAEDGSVTLTLTVDGPEPDEWLVTCTAEGEETVTKAFTGHNVTVKGLAVGKTYNFALSASEETNLLGETSLTFYASRLVMAQNLTVISCIGGDMTVRWDAPEGTNVESWTVRCYAGGHEQTQEVTSTLAVFSDIDSTLAYTVEVTAAGMTSAARTSITANPITITSMQVDAEDPAQLTLSWNFEGQAPEGGWLLLYSVDGSEKQSVVKCSEASAVIEPRIPGAAYSFVVQATDSTSLFGNTSSYRCPDAEPFKTQELSADEVTAGLVKTPDAESWTYETVGKDALTEEFTSGDSISIILHAVDDARYYIDSEEISVLYVIRDSNGNVLPEYTAQEIIDWKSFWEPGSYRYGELTIPKVPEAAGSYTVSVYFNHSAFVTAGFNLAEAEAVEEITAETTAETEAG